MFRRKKPELKFNFEKERTVGNIVGNDFLKDEDLNAHSYICGTTRSGKSTLAKVLFAALGGCKIFFNIQRDRELYYMADLTCDNPSDLFRGIMCGKKTFNYLPPSDSVGAKFHHQFIYEAAIALGGQVVNLEEVRSRTKVPIWFTLFTDEAHIVAPKGSGKDSLSMFVTRGLGLGLRSVAISQRPAITSHSVLTQSFFQFVFDISNYETKYFKQHGFDLDGVQSFFGAKKYRYIILCGNKNYFCEPLLIK